MRKMFAFGAAICFFAAGLSLGAILAFGDPINVLSVLAMLLGGTCQLLCLLKAKVPTSA